MLTNEVFGQLTVIRYAGNSKSGKRMYACRCSCGKETVVVGSHLRSGNSRSCGCMFREAVKRGTRLKHGQAIHRVGLTKEYRTWWGMRMRCTNPHNDNFARYGGRGIKVCERWSESFENFFADMGKAPTEDHSIDRINPDGNYEPGNCRWATLIEQRHNRRNVAC